LPSIVTCSQHLSLKSSLSFQPSIRSERSTRPSIAAMSGRRGAVIIVVSGRLPATTAAVNFDMNSSFGMFSWTTVALLLCSAKSFMIRCRPSNSVWLVKWCQ
jgi:hypothetical protein